MKWGNTSFFSAGAGRTVIQCFLFDVLYFHATPTSPIWPCVNFGLVDNCEGMGVKTIFEVTNSEHPIKPCNSVEVYTHSSCRLCG